MAIIDLSHPIHPEIPVYPGTEPPLISPANNIARDGFAELRITMYSHTATHIDAPSHIYDQGRSLDQFPVGHFYGAAVLIDLRSAGSAELGVECLEPYAKQIGGADFVILHTGWAEHWGNVKYFRNYPHLSPAAANWLGAFPLRGVGIDTVSVDPLDRADLPVHHELLGQGKIIIENLTNLQAVKGTAFTFSCLPLPIRAADGSPVRAVALE